MEIMLIFNQSGLNYVIRLSFHITIVFSVCITVYNAILNTEAKNVNHVNTLKNRKQLNHYLKQQGIL